MSENSGFSDESLRKIAAQKVSYRFSVKMHFIIYIVINLLLILINFLYTPFLDWFIFPLFSWLIGVSMHITGYILYARGVYPMAKRGVILHIVSFISVILFLYIVNIFTLKEFYWANFPAIFWGMAVIFHIILYLQFFSKKVEKTGKQVSRKERAIEKELEKMRKKQHRNI
ncbi:MAG: 2TM domain-containing protein [Promethearchaeota archaeon]